MFVLMLVGACLLGACAGVILGIVIVAAPVAFFLWVSPAFRQGGGDYFMLMFYTVPAGGLLGALAGPIIVLLLW